MDGAVIGAGPSGFYTAGMLLEEGFSVDMYDLLPTPYGLVRAGVAPDHPKIKSVTKRFEKIASHEQFRFFGGVTFGQQVTRRDLLDRYSVVVYALGTSSANRLGVPGEDLPGSHAATEFVAWYNGHPHFADHAYDLRVERAVVVGNGNVAIDVARMLVLHPDELAVTDTADHAMQALMQSEVREVVVLGRRGPAQGAFTNPELRELGELTRADVIVAPADVELDEASGRWLTGPEAEASTRRNVELLKAYASRAPKGDSHRVVLRFLRSPVEILGRDRVEGLRVAVNRIEAAADGRLRAVATGEQELIPCGLVIRAIGYRGEPIPDVPFDERRGLIRNEAGRVTDAHRSVLPGEYVVGWIKRGPSGVIGTNKKDAADTIARVLEDRDAGRLAEPPAPRPSEQWVSEHAPDAIFWDGWLNIDRHEVELGEPHRRPRVKLVRTAELVKASQGAPVPPARGADREG